MEVFLYISAMRHGLSEHLADMLWLPIKRELKDPYLPIQRA